MSKGLFIVVEGADRVGKSTQAKLLVDALTRTFGKETLAVRFPDRTTNIGKGLDTYLSGKVDFEPHAVHLLFTANRYD